MAMTTPLTEDDMPAAVGNEAELDRAISDLRGVLKADSDGASASPRPADTIGDAAASNFTAEQIDAAPAPAAEPHRRAGERLDDNLDLIMDIPLTVEIVLGRSRMQVSGLIGLEQGATIALDRKIGEPVDIVVNGRPIAKGEITVLENDDTRFGVRLTEVFGGGRG